MSTLIFCYKHIWQILLNLRVLWTIFESSSAGFCEIFISLEFLVRKCCCSSDRYHTGAATRVDWRTKSAMSHTHVACCIVNCDMHQFLAMFCGTMMAAINTYSMISGARYTRHSDRGMSCYLSVGDDISHREITCTNAHTNILL